MKTALFLLLFTLFAVGNSHNYSQSVKNYPDSLHNITSKKINGAFNKYIGEQIFSNTTGAIQKEFAVSRLNGFLSYMFTQEKKLASLLTHRFMDISLYVQKYERNTLGQAQVLNTLLDSVSLGVQLLGNYQYTHEKTYPQLRFKTLPLFTQLKANSKSTFTFSQGETFSKVDKYLDDYLKTSRITVKSINLHLLNEISGKVGYHNTKDITTLSHLNTFIQYLQKNNVIVKALSQKSNNQIAELFATLDQRSFSSDSSLILLKSEIDSILHKNDTIQPTELRYFSTLDLQEILLRRHPRFLSGISLYTSTTFSMKNKFDKMRIHYPFRKSDDLKDTAYSVQNHQFNGQLGLHGKINIPISARFNMVLQFNKILISSALDYFSYYRPRTSINKKNTALTYWSFSTTLWLQKVLFTIGAEGVPTYVLAPFTIPYKSYVNVGVPIDKNIYLESTFFYQSNNNKSGYFFDGLWQYPAPAQEEQYDGFFFQLSLSYQF